MKSPPLIAPILAVTLLTLISLQAADGSASPTPVVSLKQTNSSVSTNSNANAKTSTKAEFELVNPYPEAVEWCQIQSPDTSRHDLPRVLIIGDSISGGYFGGLAEELKDKASVVRLGHSLSLGQPGVIGYLRALLEEPGLLGSGNFDVIHFNNGMHGWFYSEEEYKHDFPKLIALLRERSPDAKLIWATTTPYRKGAPTFIEFHPKNERVKARNAIVAEIVAREGIPTDDLYAFEENHPEHCGDGVHFKLEARPAQVKRVAGFIADALPKSTNSLAMQSPSPSSSASPIHEINKMSGKEPSEWLDWGYQDMLHEGLPLVLMLGDEISNGYSFGVAEKLRGKAIIVRLSTTRALGDPAYLAQISSLLSRPELLGNRKFAVVHFNSGLHGMNITEEEYRRDFPKLVALLREKAPGAKLIWASTTPWNGRNGGNAKSGKTPAPDERVQARNAIAGEIVAHEEIPTDDLYALEKDHPEHCGDGLHFTREAIAAQSDHVAGVISKALGIAVPLGNAPEKATPAGK